MSVAVNTDWDINQYRTRFEPEEHWQLKKEFLEEHKNIIDEDRLVCLSQVYINVELLGCRYPTPVMNQVKHLSKGLGQQYRDSRRNKLQRTFVKASDAALSKIRRDTPPTFKKNKLLISDVEQKAPIKFPSETVSTENIGRVGTAVSNIKKQVQHISAFHPAPLQTGTTVPNVSRKRKHVSITAPSVSAEDKVSAFEQHLNVHNNSYSDLVLYHRPYLNYLNPYSDLITQSCTISKISCMYNSDQFNTRLSISGRDVAVIPKTNAKDDKQLVSLKALKILSKQCYLLTGKKRHADGDAASSVHEEDLDAGSTPMLDIIDKLKVPISSSNIGAKMMKMMGWSGEGGLGKTLSGIADPIEPHNMLSRSGLGYDGSKNKMNPMNDGQFRKAMYKMLRDFASGSSSDSSPVRNQLIFSPNFSKEQRAEIHKMSRQKKLKSVSYGKAPNRYLVVSRFQTIKDRLLEALQQGGDTELYAVAAPGTYDVTKLFTHVTPDF